MIVKRLEMMGIEGVESMIRPVSIKTHLPFQLQPKIGSPPNFGPKFIFVLRNPKDNQDSSSSFEDNFPKFRKMSAISSFKL